MYGGHKRCIRKCCGSNHYSFFRVNNIFDQTLFGVHKKCVNILWWSDFFRVKVVLGWMFWVPFLLVNFFVRVKVCWVSTGLTCLCVKSFLCDKMFGSTHFLGSSIFGVKCFGGQEILWFKFCGWPSLCGSTFVWGHKELGTDFWRVKFWIDYNTITGSLGWNRLN